MNIINELNRMKYLFNYEKGKVISEQRTETVNKNTEIQGKNKITTENKTIKFNKTFTAEYATGSDDPIKFIESAYNDIITEIKKQNPTNQPITLTSILVTGTASNSWGNKATSFDLSNDRKTYNKPTNPDSNYNKNADLSNRRSNTFLKQLQEKLISTTEPKITISQNLKPEIKSYVVDTGGVNDPIAITKTNPLTNEKYLAGQTISVNLNFVFSEQTQKIEPSENVTNFLKQYYRTSTYWCNGVDGTTNWNSDTSKQSSLSCFSRDENKKPIWKTPTTVETENKNIPPSDKKYDNINNNFITMFQVTSKPPIIPDKGPNKGSVKFSVIGTATWYFYWEGGKINKIVKKGDNFKMYNLEDEKYVESGGGEVLGNDKLMSELKAALNIPKVGTDGKFSPFNPDGYRKSYDMFVEPYLGG
jgi:hypothetical protein